MIKQFGKPGAVFACVSDSYDIYKACHMWGELKNELIQSGATLVVRPDSGDPTVIIPVCLNILEQYFGSVKNEKGYKVLNNVRMIWGDGISQLNIETILRTCVDLHGWSADMFAFGQGGGLLQNVTRDDQKYAMKCSAVCRKGEWMDVFKDPITDSGKVSKKGLVYLSQDDNGEFVTKIHGPGNPPINTAIKLVYHGGQVFNELTFDQVRKNAEIK